MAAIAKRFLTSSTISGSLDSADTAASGATSQATVLTYGTGTGSRRVIPKNTTSTAQSPPAVNAAAANVGFRENSVNHPSQDSAAADAPSSYQISGVWTFVYSMVLDAGTTALTTQMTVVCYAITAGGVSRELWRHTSGNMSVAFGTEANFTHTTSTVAATTVNTGERLQYEFYLNCSANGNAISAGVRFRLGAAGALLNAPTVTGGSMVGLFTRSPTDAAPATDTTGRNLFLPRALTDSLTTLDAAARAVVATRGLTDTVTGLDALARKYLAARALTDTTSVSDTIARALALTRALSESAPAVATLAVSFAGTRAITETLTPSDVAARKFVGTRTLSDSVATSDTMNRLLQATRALPESVPIGASIAGRSLVMTRALTENVPTTDSIQRLLTYVRGIAEYPPGVIPDYPISFPTKTIAGVVRNNDGSVFTAGATVLLVRDSDRKVVQVQVSAADGGYSFTRDTFDPYTYRVETLETSTTPAQQGSTPAGLVPA